MKYTRRARRIQTVIDNRHEASGRLLNLDEVVDVPLSSSQECCFDWADRRQEPIVRHACLSIREQAYSCRFMDRPIRRSLRSASGHSMDSAQDRVPKLLGEDRELTSMKAHRPLHLTDVDARGSVPFPFKVAVEEGKHRPPSRAASALRSSGFFRQPVSSSV